MRDLVSERLNFKIGTKTIRENLHIFQQRIKFGEENHITHSQKRYKRPRNPVQVT